MSRQRYWTTRELALFRQLWAEGWSYRSIAVVLKRTPGAICAARNWHGLPARPPHRPAPAIQTAVAAE